MPPHIRLAQHHDAAAVLALAKPFATSFVVEEQAFYGAFTEVLASPQAHLAVAIVEPQLVGYILGFDHTTFFANGRVSWVEEIMVHADFRQQGIGALLMQEFEAWAMARASKLVGLATRRAAPFYRALGTKNRLSISASYCKNMFFFGKTP